MNKDKIENMIKLMQELYNIITIKGERNGFNPDSRKRDDEFSLRLAEPPGFY